jgi:hypothetical protein
MRIYSTDLGLPGAPTHYNIQEWNYMAVTGPCFLLTIFGKIHGRRQFRPPVLSQENDREPAILTTLIQGNWTAILRSKSKAAGVALIELYRIH